MTPISFVVTLTQSVQSSTKLIFSVVTSRLFKFLWKNKRDKVKRDAMYQEYDKGGLRMIDVDVMFKSLRLAWIPWLLQNTKSNWKTVPEHFFRKCGSLRFLLRCNYHTKYSVGLPKFYRDALSFFSELKSLYNYNYSKENLLFNNQDILIDGKPFFLRSGFRKVLFQLIICFMNQAATLPFKNFFGSIIVNQIFWSNIKFFKAQYQALCLKKVGEMDNTGVEGFVQGTPSFMLDENIVLNLEKFKKNVEIFIGS